MGRILTRYWSPSGITISSRIKGGEGVVPAAWQERRRLVFFPRQQYICCRLKTGSPILTLGRCTVAVLWLAKETCFHSQILSHSFLIRTNSCVYIHFSFLTTIVEFLSSLVIPFFFLINAGNILGTRGERRETGSR